MGPRSAQVSGVRDDVFPAVECETCRAIIAERMDVDEGGLTE